ncbi:impact family protein [Ophiostoma piceae UAMH 11346]|uniref:Impact family protein n=1 Tax=Ophiostoma piceae (strain UAMH 11346) TaxID=1262450 RepID=S3BWT9_OPHP1|nr:impact family protein [Ophiostoma piceae UAMH 11346]
MPPSEDLVDEIEAINSIYGSGTLVLVESKATAQADDGGTLANLAVPASAEDTVDDDGSLDHRLCLRLWFPPAYPACPESPAVLGVQSIGDVANSHRRPGAAAHDAAQFGAALASSFQEGQVCLFDAIEAYLREKEEAREQQEAEEAELYYAEHADDEEDDDVSASMASLSVDPPPWIVAEPVIELKSVFLARCAPVTSPAQAAAYIQHLKDTDRRVRSASHNMTAYRIRQLPGSDKEKSSKNEVVFQDCDDDGETAAGGRLLHLMQLMDLWDVVVVVTRWYGGHKLGPRRFALINQAARDAFVQAGLVTVTADKKKK